ncbi:hypothetical protein [Streptomyces sp. NBC_00035]|uniref:hypothetical protein n=1 Tax=Streptomyces sp. NBC_00035 TaxID=2903614 RepID=UPI00324BB7FB
MATSIAAEMAGEFGKGFMKKTGEETASLAVEWIKRPETREALKNNARNVAAVVIAAPAGTVLVGAVVVLALGALIFWASDS